MGNWDDVFDEVFQAPGLINATFSEGPNAGKTLAWIAVFQLFDQDKLKEERALSFIQKLTKNKIPVNLDASPIEGPDRKKTVIWLFSLYAAIYWKDLKMRTFKTFEFISNPFFKESANDAFCDARKLLDNDLKRRTLNKILEDFISNHPFFNGNAAAMEGPFQQKLVYGFEV